MRQLFQTMFRDIFSEKSEKNYFQENAHIFLGTDQVMKKTLPGCVILGGYGLNYKNYLNFKRVRITFEI